VLSQEGAAGAIAWTAVPICGVSSGAGIMI
jgi:hypothetical protein